MNKLQTEQEIEKLVNLSVQAKNLLRAIGLNAVAGMEQSKQLFDELVQCGAVTDDITYAEFMNNVALKKAMLSLIACSLSDKIEDSRTYGKGVVSHFDLYFNCNTNAKFNDFLASVKFDAEGNPSVVAELLRSRDNLYALMRRTRDNTIENMELMGTPDKRDTPKKKAVVLTKDDAIKNTNEKVDKIAQSVKAIESAKRKVIRDDDDDEEDEKKDAVREDAVLKDKIGCTPPAHFDITEFMKAPKFQLLREGDPVLLKKQRDSLEWVVRVFAEVQQGEIGIGYFYHPQSNEGCICALPTELDIMRQIYTRPIGNVVVKGVRTEEEILGIPRKKAGKKGTAKGTPSQATDSDA